MKIAFCYHFMAWILFLCAKNLFCWILWKYGSFAVALRILKSLYLKTNFWNYNKEFSVTNVEFMTSFFQNCCHCRQWPISVPYLNISRNFQFYKKQQSLWNKKTSSKILPNNTINISRAACRHIKFPRSEIPFLCYKILLL